jgi:tripartite-type tricarboxylate transporter receptor subunit TctC
VQTLEETVPGLVLKAWTGISAPPGTPPEIIARLNTAFMEALRNPIVIKAMDVGGWAITPSTPEAMTARVRSELELFGPLVRKINLNFD